MKKLTFSAIAAIALMASCNSNKEESTVTDTYPTTSDSLRVALANQDSLLMLMNDVAEGMAQIKQLENVLATSGSLDAETQDKRQQIRNDMTAIMQTLKQRRERLAELEKKLKNSNSTNETLRKSIETLKQQIADQEGTIATLRNELAAANIHIEQLNNTVDSLNNTVSTVNAAKDEAEQKATDLTNELNACYYAIGSNTELKNHKLIESGFLRKTKVLPDDFEQTYFTRADKRTLTSIELGSKKAKVMTNQPKDSYEIVDNASGLKVLKITNPARFWNQSNFLIIKID